MSGQFLSQLLLQEGYLPVKPSQKNLPGSGNSIFIPSAVNLNGASKKQITFNYTSPQGPQQLTVSPFWTDQPVREALILVY